MKKPRPAEAHSDRTAPLCGLAILLAGAAVYLNSLHGVFLLDDFGHIVTSESIKSVWPLTRHFHEDRPLVHFTLAVNYAISGLDTWSYHVFNLLVHLAAGLVLFGLTRRLLLLSRAANLKDDSATLLSFVIALFWTIHPLQTQSVTYIIQRGESMMGLFYLLVLYCFVRGAQSSRPVRWYVLSVIACAAGMLSKEAMITAPFMVWLVDAIFLAKSWTGPLKRRWALYLGLIATAALLAAQGLFSDILFGSRKHGADLGFQVVGLSPLRYLLTQPEVILHYLRLCVWPYPQCFDYGWQPVADWRQAVVPGLIVLALLVMTGLLLRKRPTIGFLGAWWFIILAPTTSIIPIKDFAFEQRMYLPVAAVIAGVVLAIRWIMMRFENRWKWEVAVVLLVSLAFGARTIRRNADYASAVTIWSDVVTQRPGNVRAGNYLGVSLAVEGRQDEAIRAYEAALKFDPSSEEIHTNLARSLAKVGRFNDAIRHFEESLRQSPNDAMLHHSYALALEKVGRFDEAVGEYRRTLELQPDHPFARYNMGLAFKSAKRWADAANSFSASTRVDPRDSAAFYQWGYCLAQLGRKAEAISALERAVQLNPRDLQSQQLLQSLQSR